VRGAGDQSAALACTFFATADRHLLVFDVMGNSDTFRVGIVLGLCNPATIYATGGQLQIFAASLVSVYLYLTVSLALWPTAFILFTSFCVRYWIPICKLFSCLTHRRQAKRALREASCLCEAWRDTFYTTLRVSTRKSGDRMLSLVK
jgi:hypothetical protein